jgi:hypothetical protein
MVDYGIFHPVVNHYRWFVETLAHIARIYLGIKSFFSLCKQYTIFLWVCQVFFILRGVRCKPQ